MQLGLNYTHVVYDQWGMITAWVVNGTHLIDEPFRAPYQDEDYSSFNAWPILGQWRWHEGGMVTVSRTRSVTELRDAARRN